MVLDVVSDRRGLRMAFHWPASAPDARFTRPAPPSPCVSRDDRRISARRSAKGDVDSITFAVADATYPFLTEDESMWNFFAPELRRRLAELEASATTADGVRAADRSFRVDPRHASRIEWLTSRARSSAGSGSAGEQMGSRHVR